MNDKPWDQALIGEHLIEMGLDRDLGNFDPPPTKSHIALNLGAGGKHITGAIELQLPEWNANTDEIPYMNESVEVIYAMHFLEHVEDPLRVLAECQRVLAVGGTLNIVVPYYSAQINHQDLDHKHSFTEDTWKIAFNNPYYNTKTTGMYRGFEWKFNICFNLIAGINERNLCLFTQLQKHDGVPF